MVNISLASATQSNSNKRKLLCGLNKKESANVFRDTEEQEEEAVETGRGEVNRELHREQEALRQRASAAAYDFDGTYDETKKSKDQATENKPTEKRESRYMTDLLKNAKCRNHQRDMAHERKMVREQEEEEEENPEFRGKEKFITSAYKKKLQERELWAKEEEDQRKRDEESDVTKRKSDGMMSFYSNFNKNIAVGGKNQSERTKVIERKEGFLDGFAKSNNENPMDETKNEVTLDSKKKVQNSLEPPKKDIERYNSDPNLGENETPSKTKRQVRNEKVNDARQRYFKRVGLMVEQA